MNNANDLILKQLEQAVELRAKFFFHISILSGATLSLIVPLISSLNNSVERIEADISIHIAILLLVISLILSALRNYIGAHSLWRIFVFNTKGIDISINEFIKKQNKYKYLQYSIEAISILSYTTSLFCLYIFISANYLQ